MNNQPSKSIEQTKLNFKNQDLWINKYKPVSINNIIGKHVKIPIRNFFKSNDNFNNVLPP